MIWLRRISIAITTAFVFTAGSAVLSLIVTMFMTSGSEPGRRTTLFGGLFFEVRDGTNGAVEMGFGVLSFAPIAAIFLLSAVFVLAFQIALKLLLAYRTSLIASRAGA